MPTDQELLSLLNRRAAGEHEVFEEPSPPAVAEVAEDPDRPPLIPYVKQDRVPTILRGLDLLLASYLRINPDQLVILGGQVSPWRRGAFFEIRTGPGEERVAGHAIVVVTPLGRDRIILVAGRELAEERWRGVIVAMLMMDREDRDGTQH